jgi:hypothetical protein
LLIAFSLSELYKGVRGRGPPTYWPSMLKYRTQSEITAG